MANPVVAGRIKQSQKKEMEELNLNVQEAVNIALTVKRDKEGLKRVELMDLLNENERLSMKIVMNNERVTCLKDELGYSDYSNEQLTNKFVFSKIAKNVQAVLDRFHIKNSSSYKRGKIIIEDNMYNFLSNDKNRNYIESKAKECGLTVEEFENEVLKVYESSKQQVLVD